MDKFLTEQRCCRRSSLNSLVIFDLHEWSITGLSSNAKLFADDTSLLSVTLDINTSANELNNDLAKINNWASQWKMNFNPDSSRQAQEVIFSRKSKKISHPPLFFSNIQVPRSSSQKHLGIVLEEYLTFCKHLKMLTSKINRTIGLLRKLQNLLPRSALITTYKSLETHIVWCMKSWSRLFMYLPSLISFSK